MKLHLCLTLITVNFLSLGAIADPGPVTLAPAERAELLGRLESIHSSFPSMEANFSEDRSSHLLKKPVSSSGRIAFQSPNKFRREVTGPNASITVSNGHFLWIYYPNFKEVEEYALGQRAAFDDAMAALTAGLNFAKVESFYNVDAAREGGGYRITLVPKRGNLKRTVQQLTVVLDGELNVRRTDLILPKGDQIVTTYSNPRRTSIPASLFEFSPPADAQVTHPLGK